MGEGRSNRKNLELGNLSGGRGLRGVAVKSVKENIIQSVLSKTFFFYYFQKEKHLKKKVTFNEEIKIRNMIVWNYAYKAARKADWMTIVNDRLRFKRRIQQMEEILKYVLLKKNVKKK